MPARGQPVPALIERVSAATARLLATAPGVTDELARGPSLLPGWTRGHVLTHIARNADGLANLLTWARTGIQTPQYPSRDARDADIEAGAGRPASELIADLSASARAFMARARELSPDDWLAVVGFSRGPDDAAWTVLQRRLVEVEVHHADLDAGYGPRDWPGWFVSEGLGRIAAGIAAGEHASRTVLTDTTTGDRYQLGADQAGLTVAGPGWRLLAWLLGRDDGAALRTDPAGPLPGVPPI